MSVIEEIKQRLTIGEVLSWYGLKPKNGKIFSIYKDERTPSLHIYSKTNSFCDFATNTSGDVIDFYRDYNGLDTATAIKELASKLGIADSERKSSFSIDKRQKPKPKLNFLQNKRGKEFEDEIYYFDERAGIYELNGNSRKQAEEQAEQSLKNYRKEIRREALTQFTVWGKLHTPIEERNYLKNKRRLTDEMIERFSLFGINPIEAEEFLRENYSEYERRVSGLFNSNDKFIFKKHTVIIPYLEDGETVYMKARTLDDNAELKYFGLSGISSKRFYNVDVLKTSDEVLIVEGEFDAIASVQLTGNSAIAIGGVGNIPDLSLLKNKRVYILFDNDEAGKRESKALFDKLKPIAEEIHLLGFNDNIKDTSEML